MRLQDVMTRGVRTIPSIAPSKEAWALMRLHNIHHLVVTEGRRVVGVLSARDRVRQSPGARAARATVADVMTAPPVTADQNTTVRRAANTMRGRSIGCMVVVDSDRPVGIVTVSDLLELMGRGFDRTVAASPRRTLSHRVPHKKAHAAVRAW
jgi:CBS domain-containing protein